MNKEEAQVIAENILMKDPNNNQALEVIKRIKHMVKIQ